MLNAYLYRVRRSLLKHPWKFILVIFFLAVFVLMMAYPTLMSMPNSDGTMGNSYVPRDIGVVTGGVYFILILMFGFMFFTGVKNGVIGFSTADVVFHMSGPFTPRFNLLLAASGTLQVCLIFAFLLCTQTAIIYQAIGVSTADLLFLVLGSFVSAVFGYFTGSFFGARFSDNDGKKRIVIIVAAAVILAFIAVFAVNLLIENPDVRSLGLKGIISEFGSSKIIKIFPGAGWLAMIYDGIINGSVVTSVAGGILTVGFVAFVVVFYGHFEIDYYEEAIEYAQKAQDLAEQKRAGVDSDTAAMTKRAKVGKEKMGGGEGASALTAIHFLMNKRGSKFFFVNPVAMMYRVITACYLVFMGRGNLGSESSALLMSAFMMMILLNAVLYAGGKTVMEFTKPFVYLIPEKASRKLLACIRADLPEMCFDAVLCGALMYFLVKFTLIESLAFALMMVAFDLLSETTALLIMRSMPALGKTLLLMIRNLGTFVVAGIACVPIVIVYFITDSMTAGILTGAGAGAILFLIMLPIASVVVEKAEM